MAKNVVGLFDRSSDAQAAVQDLTGAGFDSSSVTLVKRVSSQLTEIFGQLGVPQDDATIYRDGVANGGALVVVQQLGDANADRAADILNQHHLVDVSQRARSLEQSTTSGQHVEATGSTSNTSSHSGRYDGGEVVIPIVEEELHVGKRAVEGGGVRVETSIEERPVSEQVTLHQEEVHVERRAVNQPIDPSEFDSLAQTGSFDVRERAEEAIVTKEARIVEEVVINKQAQERTETIEDTVRRTDVNVEELSGTTRASAVTEVTNTSASNVTSTSGRKGKGKTKKRGKR